MYQINSFKTLFKPSINDWEAVLALSPKQNGFTVLCKDWQRTFGWAGRLAEVFGTTGVGVGVWADGSGTGSWWWADKSFEFYDILSAVLTKANNGALICPVLGPWIHESHP